MKAKYTHFRVNEANQAAGREFHTYGLMRILDDGTFEIMYSRYLYKGVDRAKWFSSYPGDSWVIAEMTFHDACQLVESYNKDKEVLNQL